MRLDGEAARFADPAAANAAGDRLRLPGIVADARPVGRRQYLHLAPSEASRHDRPARPASPRRGVARRDRLRGRQSAAAGARPAAVAPADGRDRQGARQGAAPAHPRRIDLGADQRRRRQGLWGARTPQGEGRRHPLHLASDARGGRARRPRLGVPQRPPYRDLRDGRALDKRDRPTHDRPRHRHPIPPEAGAPGPEGGVEGRAPLLGQAVDRHLARGRRGRDRRPRRPRRPGPEDVAAGAVRRPAWCHWRDVGRRSARSPRARPARRSRGASASRWCPRTARPKG